MITDKIDGDLARKHNLVTDFGKIADPIADKAITGMAFIGLSIVGDVWWWVTIVVLVREWSVTLLRLSVLKHVVMPAAQSGKLKTTLQARRARRADAAAAARRRPRRRVRPARAAGEVLFYLGQVLLAGRRGDDAVVGLRVLPRRVAAAGLTRRQIAEVRGHKGSCDLSSGLAANPCGGSAFPARSG